MIELKMPQSCIELHIKFVFQYKTTQKPTTIEEKLQKRLKVLKELQEHCDCSEDVKSEYCLCKYTVTEKEKYIKVYCYIIDNLKEIIIGNIDTLKSHITIIEREIENLSGDCESQLRKDINSFFGSFYEDSFVKGISLKRNEVYWGAYEYLRHLEILVCSYCNSQFTFLIDENGKTRPDLDHFLSKKKYPYLAISLFNLVPSCKICNSSFKGEKETSFEGYFNPFESGVADYIKFKRTIDKDTKDYVQAILGAKSDMKIEINIGDNAPLKIKNKIMGNCKLFQLEEVYKFHTLYVQKTILQFTVYNTVYQKQLAGTFPKIFDSQLEWHRLLIPSISDFKSTILGKLTHDILNEELKDN